MPAIWNGVKAGCQGVLIAHPVTEETNEQHALFAAPTQHEWQGGKIC